MDRHKGKKSYAVKSRVAIKLRSVSVSKLNLLPLCSSAAVDVPLPASCQQKIRYPASKAGSRIPPTAKHQFFTSTAEPQKRTEQ
jgi:hypothetical protein